MLTVLYYLPHTLLFTLQSHRSFTNIYSYLIDSEVGHIRTTSKRHCKVWSQTSIHSSRDSNAATCWRVHFDILCNMANSTPRITTRLTRKQVPPADIGYCSLTSCIHFRTLPWSVRICYDWSVVCNPKSVTCRLRSCYALPTFLLCIIHRKDTAQCFPWVAGVSAQFRLV